jgi:magnesium transporter
MSTAIAFDFADKTTEQVALQDVAGLIGAGAYCWLDFDDLHTACTTLAELGVDPTTVDRVIKNQAEGQFQLGRNCIHCTVIETRVAGEELRLCALQVILGQNFLVTVHSHPSKVIERVLETYEEDFLELAESGGFLLFELADHLIAGYRDELLRLSHGVEDIQKRLLGDVGDEILRDVSELTRSLLDYRNAAVTAREVIHELATRRSPYVSPSTHPYLDRQTVSLERLAGDAATERTVLSETLALYMGIVSHRTNKVVNRLTVVSMVFLPLNFLAAVYGMNFENMPELGWRYGYAGFWGAISIVVCLLLWNLRRRRWL